jgi:nucleoside phosphorylase
VEILRPKAVICVGYCGSVKPEKAKLGHVVISAKLATYSNKKITEDGTEELRGIKVNASRHMGDLIPFAADAWNPPLAEESSDFEVEVHREDVMLSGPELVNNSKRRQQLLSHYPDAIAIEMEGEGTYIVNNLVSHIESEIRGQFLMGKRSLFQRHKHFCYWSIKIHCSFVI